MPDLWYFADVSVPSEFMDERPANYQGISNHIVEYEEERQNIIRQRQEENEKRREEREKKVNNSEEIIENWNLH